MRLEMWYVIASESSPVLRDIDLRPAIVLRIWGTKWIGMTIFSTFLDISNSSQGEEVLYLPAIVESCESSPSAAKEAAYVIRKFLSKDNYGKPYVQYNGIMLIRILANNPGKTFTRNIDTKFVQVVKELAAARGT
jgi:hypothetical protein